MDSFPELRQRLRGMHEPRDFLFETLECRNLLAANWGLESVAARQVWQQGHTGEGIVVAVVDSGINLHRDLIPSLWTNPYERVNTIDDDQNGYVNDLNGWDFVENDNNPVTDNRHGNHVLGIVAAANDQEGITGVAYDASVMPLRVFDDDGSSATKYVADAIRFAVDHGADIVNLSVGGIASQDVQSAIRYANTHDVLIVAAAGNEAASQPDFPASASVGYSNVISVGAHDQAFQSWSHTNRVGSSGAVQIDAPGVDILSTSTNGGYATSTGTSSAAAHVAGVAALLLSADPSLGAAEVRDALVAGAQQQSVKGSDATGAVNAQRSLASLDISAAQVERHFADFDASGAVDFNDFLILGRNFGGKNKTSSQGDVDRNGTVDFADFLAFSRAYARPSPPPVVDH